MQVLIRGQPVKVAKNSLRIDWRTGECSTCSLSVIDMDASTEYRRGESLEIYDDENTLVFSGVVDKAVFRHEGTMRSHQLTGRCWTYLADKRIIARSWVGAKAGDIVKDIVTDWLSEEGVVEGDIYDGPEIAEFLANYRPATEVLNKLAEVAGFMWFIGLTKKLYFIPRGEFDAPFILTQADLVKRTPQVEFSSPEYRNRQYVVDVLSITDPQVEASRGDGETRAFPTRYPVATVPKVEIDRGSGFVEETVGIRGLEGGKQWYWSKGDSIISQDDGETPLGPNDLIRITYRGQFWTVVISEDAHQIVQRQAIEGGSGVVEAVDRATQDTPTEAAFQLAAAKLREFGLEGRMFSFQTWRHGLRPGQLLTVDIPAYGLSGKKLLIESVSTFHEGTMFFYDVKAVEGPRRRSWTAFFASLVDQAAGLDRVAVGEDRAVTLLVPVSEDWSWAEDVQVDVFACPVPSSTSYPDSTLYPC